MQTRSRKAARRASNAPRLMDLPDAAVEAIATCLPPTSMAHLQCTCKQFRSLLAQERYLPPRAPCWIACCILTLTLSTGPCLTGFGTASLSITTQSGLWRGSNLCQEGSMESLGRSWWHQHRKCKTVGCLLTPFLMQENGTNCGIQVIGCALQMHLTMCAVTLCTDITGLTSRHLHQGTEGFVQNCRQAASAAGLPFVSR